MIRHYLFPISALMVLAIATSVSAQRPAGRPAASPVRLTDTGATPAAPLPTVALPTSKMAVIYTDAVSGSKDRHREVQ